MKGISDRVKACEKHVQEVDLYQSVALVRPAEEIQSLLEKNKEMSPLRLSRIHVKLGDFTKALEAAERAVKDTEGQVLPLANLAEVQWKADKLDEARRTFEKLRPLCAQADLGEPVFERLRPLAQDLRLPEDWRPRLEWKGDSGERPDLATLGPFRWAPYAAPDWRAVDPSGKVHSLASQRGRPTLLVFYLGSGCAHCIAQLNALAPVARDFAAAGIDIIAVSTDSAENLGKTVEQAKDKEGFPFPLAADPELVAFKAYRAFDDFEGQPLHGTFLIDAAGRVRWQDISSAPFDEVEWLLAESKRLLALPAGP